MSAFADEDQPGWHRWDGSDRYPQPEVQNPELFRPHVAEDPKILGREEHE